MLPLFDYTLLPPSLTPPLWPWQTPTPLVTSDGGGLSLSPAVRYLTAYDPACYETAVGSLICLGQVKNEYDQPVENVVVVVQIVAQNGQPLAAREAFVSRWILPVGAVGPYRVLFDEVPAGYAGVRVAVKAGDVATNVERRYANLALRQVSGTFILDQYQISLTVINQGKTPVSNLAVMMVLLDRQGRVTGFRQVRLSNDRILYPGESLAMTVRVIPQGPDTVGFEAFAEGYIVPQ